MDLNTEHPDPFRDAMQEGIYRAVQIGSFAVTGTQVYAYHRRAQARTVTEQNQRARSALQAHIRAERDAARTAWAPALTPAWLRKATLTDTAQAWGAALPYSDLAVPWYEPTAATAMRACEDRLRDLHPFAMARYDRLRRDGLGPAEAMREAAPLFALHPRARDGSYTPRPVLETAPSLDRVPASAAPVPPAGQALGDDGRSARVTRACEEDFPLTIHEVLAADAGPATAEAADLSSRAVREARPGLTRP
jgi:hypothetical protein